jgi:hypothetical protein
MPNISASDYTTYLKFKAASISPIKPNIQTRDNVSLSQSVINANILASQAAFVTTPRTVTVSQISATVSTARTDVLTDAVRASDIITYTSSQPHGLTSGDVVSIQGFSVLTDANVSSLEVLVTGATTFTIEVAGADETATGTARIAGRVYYTTSEAHTLVAGQQEVTVTGLSTSVFDFTRATIFLVPSATTFIMAITSTGTASTDQTAAITIVTYANTRMAVTGISSVRPVQPMRTNNPNALSTLSWSGTLSSSVIQRPGGLPGPARSSQSTYYHPAQLAGWKNAGPPGR